MGVDEQLLDVVGQPPVVPLGPGLRFEVQQLQSAVLAQQEIHAARQDVGLFFQRDVHLGLDHLGHPVLVLREVVLHLLKGHLLLGVADGAESGVDQVAEVGGEQARDRHLDQAQRLPVQHPAVDVLDRLVHQRAEEDLGRAGGGERVLAEELVLARAGLVHLEVVGEGEGLLGGHPLFEREVLRRQQVLLHVGPLGQALPDGVEVHIGSVGGGQGQHLLGPREGHVVQPHAVELGDPLLRLEGLPVVERPQQPVLLLGRADPGGQRAGDHDRELQPLALVDRHHLDVARGEGPVGVLVLVDASLVEEAQEAVEEVQADEAPVGVGDDGVVVVVLEDGQQLAEDGQVARPVLVAHRAGERFVRDELVQVVGQVAVQGLAFVQSLDLGHPLLQRPRQRMVSHTPARARAVRQPST